MARKPISYETFSGIKSAARWEPEFSLTFAGNCGKYMIIPFEQSVSFQRYGLPEEQTGEIWFDSLDALYGAETIDGICLKRDWERIESLIADFRYDLFDEDDLERFIADNGLSVR